MPQTPATGAERPDGGRERAVKNNETVYTTPANHYPQEPPTSTPLSLLHPSDKPVGLDGLLERARERRDSINGNLPPRDPLTGKIIWGGEGTELNHIAHAKLILFIDYYRISKLIGVEYLNPHSVGNVLESLVDVHTSYGQLRDILIPTHETMEKLRSFFQANRLLIMKGEKPMNMFEDDRFLKSYTWDYEFGCMDRKTPLHSWYRKNGTWISDQSTHPGRVVPMPAYGYMLRSVPTYPIYVLIGSSYAIHKGVKNGKYKAAPFNASQRERTDEMLQMAKDCNLFQPMTPAEYKSLQKDGYAPDTIDLFAKLAGGSVMNVGQGKNKIQVKFDPTWRRTLDVARPRTGTTDAITGGESSGEEEPVQDTSVELEDPADEYGLSLAKQKRRQKEHRKVASKWTFTPKAILKKSRERRQQQEEPAPQESSSAETSPQPPPRMKRRLAQRAASEDPFDSDEIQPDSEGERPRKKARTAAPAQKSTSRPVRRSARTRQPAASAAVQQSQPAPSQPVAGPGPRTLANQLRANAQQAVAVAGPVPSSSRSFRSAVQEATRSRVTESTVASRARTRAPARSQPQPSQAPSTSTSKGKGKSARQ